MHASMLWAGPRIRRCPSLPSPLGGQATFPNLTVPLRGLNTWETTEMKAGAFSKLVNKDPREHGYLHIDPIKYNNQLLENQSFSAHIRLAARAPTILSWVKNPRAQPHRHGYHKGLMGTNSLYLMEHARQITVTNHLPTLPYGHLQLQDLLLLQPRHAQPMGNRATTARWLLPRNRDIATWQRPFM